MSARNKTAMMVAIVGGILLLISGTSGAAAWESVKNFVVDNVTDNESVQIVFAILIMIASFGGIVVILGGILIGKDKVLAGKILIALGAGLGLIGLIIALIIATAEKDLTIGGLLSIGGVGVILSVIATVMAKRTKKTEKKAGKK
jgi:hypothetical protein